MLKRKRILESQLEFTSSTGKTFPFFPLPPHLQTAMCLHLTVSTGKAKISKIQVVNVCICVCPSVCVSVCAVYQKATCTSPSDTDLEQH